MIKFVVEPCNDVVGKVKFSKLIEDTVCYWNIFCLQIEREVTWESQLDQLKSIMNDVSNIRLLPNNKFKKLIPPSTDEYEVKTHDLRAYLLLDENGYIILYASKKSEQNGAIVTFRSIKKRYLEYKNYVKRKTT
jgi:hypothetical protein